MNDKKAGNCDTGVDRWRVSGDDSTAEDILEGCKRGGGGRRGGGYDFDFWNPGHTHIASHGKSTD